MPFWASGWSARGLRKIDEQIQPYLEPLNQIRKDSIILLHFGSVDTDFNLPYKMATSGFYDIPVFISEMIDGNIAMKKYLNNLGFNNTYAVFSALPIPLPRDFWKDIFNIEQISEITRGKILWDFADKLSEILPTINCLSELAKSERELVCDERFARLEYDHHINFITAQDIVYKKYYRYAS